MSVFHAVKSNNFCQISNSLASDPTISFKAKGIMLYLLSKPENWKVYESDIVNHCADGRDSIRSGIKELISAGYIVRSRTRKSDGKFEGTSYNVYESIEMAKSLENSATDGKTDIGKSDIGKPNISNTDLSNTDSKKTDFIKPSFPGNDEPEFDPSNFDEESFRFIQYFVNEYRKLTGKAHPAITREWLEKIDELVRMQLVWDDRYNREIGISIESLYKMVDRYFATKYPLRNGGYADHRLYHFLSDNVLVVLAFKEN